MPDYEQRLPMLTQRIDGRWSARARQDARTCLTAFQILPIDERTLLAADSLAGNDFEDNLQIAAAAAAHLDYIVTRNVADFSASSIRAVTPSQSVSRSC